jgi:hypothetical protein
MGMGTFVAAFDPTGQPDLAFGDPGGIAQIGAAERSEGFGPHLDASGKLILVGLVLATAPSDAWIARVFP